MTEDKQKLSDVAMVINQTGHWAHLPDYALTEPMERLDDAVAAYQKAQSDAR